MVNILARIDEVQESYNQIELKELEFCAYNGSVCVVGKKNRTYSGQIKALTAVYVG